MFIILYGYITVMNSRFQVTSVELNTTSFCNNVIVCFVVTILDQDSYAKLISLVASSGKSKVFYGSQAMPV